MLLLGKKFSLPSLCKVFFNLDGFDMAHFLRTGRHYSPSFFFY